MLNPITLLKVRVVYLVRGMYNNKYIFFYRMCILASIYHLRRLHKNMLALFFQQDACQGNPCDLPVSFSKNTICTISHMFLPKQWISSDYGSIFATFLEWLMIAFYRCKHDKWYIYVRFLSAMNNI